MSYSGHFWTIWPLFDRRLRPPPETPGEPWTTDIHDPEVGQIRLTGSLLVVDDDALIVLVHGLGGSIDSSYMGAAARTARDLGVSSLRLNLRGADRRGGDFYHAGLSSDLGQVLRSPELAGFGRIFIAGFSLGGHLSLRFATEVEDPRVRAVAAVCSPLDLERSVEHIDRPANWIYRRYLLRGLLDMAQNHQGEMPAPLDELRRVRRIRDWDRATVVRRFGFASAEDYYRRAGVGRRLDQLRRPSLLVVARHDPMVPEPSVTAALPGPDSLRVEWVDRGGHIGFPSDVDLGMSGPVGVHGQVLSWLIRQ